MAGPWFTVVEDGSEEWTHVENLWISNGEAHEKARVEIRVALEEEE